MADVTSMTIHTLPFPSRDPTYVSADKTATRSVTNNAHPACIIMNLSPFATNHISVRPVARHCEGNSPASFYHRCLLEQLASSASLTSQAMLTPRMAVCKLSVRRAALSQAPGDKPCSICPDTAHEESLGRLAVPLSTRCQCRAVQERVVHSQEQTQSGWYRCRYMP